MFFERKKKCSMSAWGCFLFLCVCVTLHTIGYQVLSNNLTLQQKPGTNSIWTRAIMETIVDESNDSLQTIEYRKGGIDQSNDGLQTIEYQNDGIDQSNDGLQTIEYQNAGTDQSNDSLQTIEYQKGGIDQSNDTLRTIEYQNGGIDQTNESVQTIEYQKGGNDQSNDNLPTIEYQKREIDQSNDSLQTIEYQNGGLDQSNESVQTIEYQNGRESSPDTDAGPADVMLMAYMRTGSSVMGQILGYRHDTFYWYEPLHTTHRYTYIKGNGDVCNYGSHGCKQVPDDAVESLNQSKHFLLDLYNCENIEKHVNVNFRGLAASHSFSGPTESTFRHCLRANTCHTYINDTCHRAKHRVTKVLRLATAHAQYFLDKLPRLKLVQIFRDPRGIINSLRQSWHGTQKRSDDAEAEVLCNRMEADLDAVLELKRLYPGRVQILQYETLSNPTRLARHLYHFLNLDMTLFERHQLKSINKEFNPNSYRTKADWTLIAAVNNHCRKLLHRLGYRVFEDMEELRNLNTSAIMGELPFQY